MAYLLGSEDTTECAVSPWSVQQHAGWMRCNTSYLYCHEVQHFANISSWIALLKNEYRREKMMIRNGCGFQKIVTLLYIHLTVQWDIFLNCIAYIYTCNNPRPPVTRPGPPPPPLLTQQRQPIKQQPCPQMVWPCMTTMLTTNWITVSQPWRTRFQGSTKKTSWLFSLKETSGRRMQSPSLRIWETGRGKNHSFLINAISHLI